MLKSILTIFSVLLLFNFTSFAQVGSNLNTNNVQAAFPYNDDAEDTTASYASWQRDAAQWQIKTVSSHSGSQAWVMQQGTGGYNYITLSSGINLSSAPDPYIQCWVRRSDGGGGYISLEASSDGGSTWKALIQPYFTGTSYTRVQASLFNYTQANILVRIGCYAPSGSYYLDDILIDNAPTPQSFVLLNPTNNGMELKWGQSTASDFGLYRIVISTNQGLLK